MNSVKKCNNCALRTAAQGMCPIFRADMTGESGCPQFTTHISACELCGALIPKGGFIETDEDGMCHLICGGCLEGDMCRRCVETSYCAFQEDQSCKEPPYVMVTQRQGNMTMQTQQLNMKRVEQTCAKGCKCYYEAGLPYGDFCYKTASQGCNNFKPYWRNK